MTAEALKEASRWMHNPQVTPQLREEWEQWFVRYCNSPAAVKAFKEAERDPRRDDLRGQFMVPDIVDTFKKLVEEDIRRGDLDDVERLLRRAADTPLAKRLEAQVVPGESSVKQRRLLESLAEQAQPLRQKLQGLQTRIDHLLQGASTEPRASASGDYRLRGTRDFVPTLQRLIRDAPAKERDARRAAAEFVLQQPWLAEEDEAVVEAFLSRFPDDARADEVRWQYARWLSQEEAHEGNGYVPARWTQAMALLSALMTQPPSSLHREDARRRLQSMMSRLPLAAAELNLPRMARQHESTEVGRMAQLALAEVYLRHRRSDAAAEVLRQLMQEAPTSAEADAARPLLRRAEREIAARKQGVLDTLFVLPVPKGARLSHLGERLLVAAQDLRCIEPTTQRVVWRRRVRPLCEPAVDGKHVFVVTPESALLCLDAATGATQWQQHLPVSLGKNPSGQPSLWVAVSEDTVLVWARSVTAETERRGIGETGTFAEVAARSSRPAPKKRAAKSKRGTPPRVSPVPPPPEMLLPSPELPNAPPPSPSDNLLAYNPQTGALRWKVTRQFAPLTPALSEQTVFCSMADGGMEALDVTTGDIRWRRQLAPKDDKVEWSGAPAALAGRVVVPLRRRESSSTLHGDTLVCVDAATGDELWQQDMGASAPLQAVLLPSDGRRLVACFSQTLQLVDPATGAARWAREFPLSHDDSLLLHGTTLYLKGGQLYAFEDDTGALVGESDWDIEGEFRGAPVVIGDIIYAVTEDEDDVNWLVAMRAK